MMLTEQVTLTVQVMDARLNILNHTVGNIAQEIVASGVTLCGES